MSTLATMRERLKAEQAEMQAEIEKLDQRLGSKPDYSLGTGDPAVYQWELNLALKEQSVGKLQQIREAMQRMEAGSYGNCAKCGGKIEAERLEVLPTTLTCAPCARTARPVR